MDTPKLLLQHSVMLRDSKHQRAHLGSMSRAKTDCHEFLVCFTSACLSRIPGSESRSGCRDKSVASSAAPFAVCFWGLQSTREHPWRLRKPNFPATSRCALHACDMLTIRFGFSATDCHKCVEKHFVTSDGTNRAEWLDVVVELTHDGTLCLGPKKAELEWAHKPDVPCGRYLVPPFVNHLSLDWVLLCGMVKMSLCPIVANVLSEGCPALRHEVRAWRRSG